MDASNDSKRHNIEVMTDTYQCISNYEWRMGDSEKDGVDKKDLINACAISIDTVLCQMIVSISLPSGIKGNN